MNIEHLHQYHADLAWTGNTGVGTRDYRSYQRDYCVRIDGKPELAASSDAAFHGDATRHNPEDLLLAALAGCHMLSYLHMAMLAGVVVTAYADHATGSMRVEGHGGHFTEVVLHPQVTISAESDAAKALAAHEAAHAACFIANSVNFPVRCEPHVVVAS